TVYIAVKGATTSQTGNYAVSVSESSPYALKDGHLRIVGTAGNDSLTVKKVGTVLTVTMNGTSSSFTASEVKRVTFDGGVGTDTARFYGTAERESWALRGNTMTVS